MQNLMIPLLSVCLVFQAFCARASATENPPQPDSAEPPSQTDSALTPDPAAHYYVFGLGFGLGVGGAVSWKFMSKWTGKFANNDEGWFGPHTYSGGADKIGHYYTDFVLVRALHHVYQSYNYQEEEAIANAFWASMTIRTAMELADGFTSFKFSPQDLIANMLGSITSAFLLHHPELDRTFSFSWTYAPSTEKLDGKVDKLSIDNDYNGSVYHLDINLKGALDLVGYTKKSLFDYHTVSISYYTRGYDRERPQKHRMLGLSYGINLAEVIGSHPESLKGLQGTRSFLKYFKLPFSFAGILYDLDHHSVGFRYGLNFFY